MIQPILDPLWISYPPSFPAISSKTVGGNLTLLLTFSGLSPSFTSSKRHPFSYPPYQIWLSLGASLQFSSRTRSDVRFPPG